jgi:putative transposase
VLAERWRVHYNIVRSHSNKPPAPGAWPTSTAWREGVAIATLLPPLPAKSCNNRNSEVAALH